MGITLCAYLLWEYLPRGLGGFRLILGVLGAAVAYGLPAELARAFVLRRPEQMAPKLLSILRPLELLAAPLAAPISWVASSLVHRGLGATSGGVTETEVELLVNEGERAGALGHDQGEMIRNVLDFGEIQAVDVMVPRTKVTSFDLQTPIEEVLKLIAKSQHSRYPVYSGQTDNIVGLLHVKDLIGRAADGDLHGFQLKDVVRQPIAFIPETQLASTVLTQMRLGRHHMAVVLDEFGGYSGIVTIEDLIEEIVGDIRDEHDGEEVNIVELDDGKMVVDAGIAVSDLGRHLGLDLDEGGDYTSVGGLIVERVGRVPPVGTTVSAYGLRFVVREADERHVVKVEIEKISGARTGSSSVSAA